MQFFSTVCALLFLALLVIAETNTCSHPGEEEKEEANYLIKEGLVCQINVSLAMGLALRADNTTERYQNAVKQYCNKNETFSQCIEGVKAKARACLNETMQDMVMLTLENMVTHFDATCIDDGRTFATYTEEMQKFAYGQDVFTQCRQGASAANPFTFNLNEVPNNSMLYLLRLRRQVVSCLEGHRGEGSDGLVDAGKAYMTNLIDRMKCFDMNTHYILCKTIVDNVE